MAALTLPVFYALNRPSLQWLARAAYDFALRCNGFAITFKGRHGLTLGEENFLRRRFGGVQSRVFFDVGANHGAYVGHLRMLAPLAKIYAFEPHPKSFAVLAAAVAPNNTTLINKAVSDTAGAMKLYDFASHDGSTQASLSRDAVSLFTPGVVEHEIECITLDDFIAEHGIEAIDFLKVDTEGYDLNVLKGARKALASKQIAALQFEFIPANIVTRTTMRDFFEVLAGYQIYRMCLNGSLIPLEPYNVKRCEVYVVHNLIAIAR